MSDLREKIIDALEEFCDEYMPAEDAADVVIAVLREQEPVVKTAKHHSEVRKVLQHFKIPHDGVLEADLIYAMIDNCGPLYAAPVPPAESFQSRVQPWLMECFGPMIAGDKEERNHRFIEEALELVQSCGCSQSEVLQLVDYVYGRPVGEPIQEVGGVMVTLAALCLAHGMDMHECGEVELARIWTKVEQIRSKQAGKPKHSPLPIHARAQALGLTAYYSTPAEPVVPDGWVLVPVELTPEMVEAACYRDCSLREEYAALIAAAPKYKGGE